MLSQPYTRTRTPKKMTFDVRPNWRTIVLHLIDYLEAEGFTLVECDDGLEGIVNPTKEQAVDLMTATDEANAWFKGGDDPKAFRAYLVYGNAAEETVNDFTSRNTRDGRRFEKAMEAWADLWAGQAVPVKTREVPPHMLSFINAAEQLVNLCHQALPKDQVQVVAMKKALELLALSNPNSPRRDPYVKAWMPATWKYGEEGTSDVSQA